MKNIQNFISHKKGIIDFCRLMAPFPQNSHILPQTDFCNFFPIILLVSKNLFNTKISGTDLSSCGWDCTGVVAQIGD